MSVFDQRARSVFSQTPISQSFTLVRMERRMERRRRRRERRRRWQRWRESCVKLLIRFLLYFHSPGFNFGGGGRRGGWGCVQWLLDQLAGELQHHQHHPHHQMA